MRSSLKHMTTDQIILFSLFGAVFGLLLWGRFRYDLVAFGALMALQERGLTPGVDVSVIGVDDHEFAHVVELTTIRQNVVDNGAAAARALLAAIQDPRTTTGDAEPAEAETPTFSLVARSSTGPLNGHRADRTLSSRLP